MNPYPPIDASVKNIVDRLEPALLQILLDRILQWQPAILANAIPPLPVSRDMAFETTARVGGPSNNMHNDCLTSLIIHEDYTCDSPTTTPCGWVPKRLREKIAFADFTQQNMSAMQLSIHIHIHEYDQATGCLCVWRQPLYLSRATTCFFALWNVGKTKGKK